MTDERLAHLATALFTVIAAMFLVGLAGVAVVTSQGAYAWREVVPDFLVSSALLAVAAVALVIARRQPRNAIPGYSSP